MGRFTSEGTGNQCSQKQEQYGESDLLSTHKTLQSFVASLRLKAKKKRNPKCNGI